MIVLASGSPRRRHLLEMLGIPHEVVPADVPEEPQDGEQPEVMAVRLATEKAVAVHHRRPDALILAADTVVTIDGQLLGKPVDAADAERMLHILSGRSHRVITAVALALPTGEVRERCDITEVWFRRLTPETIRSYVATGEPLDKAGSYGVQGVGAVLIERVEGDFFGVMGLPVRLVVDLLDGAGRPYRFNR
ncbi:MAG: Maf family protein [Gemmatimonadota bacterium]|nr:Maf family protein [Gemmatimonadota bacterium]MDH3366954.1 Maf family protein [Gemmatimonadota bacterium]MDH3478104.1 Maf family protein [Gemmatimonadota bacterium]MDH3571600.1 Maf family protein [Gemmatimonadota bacterium]MDH5549414.1 Maf family protein [Gemmatimonadota bacterium]